MLSPWVIMLLKVTGTTIDDGLSRQYSSHVSDTFREMGEKSALSYPGASRDRN